MDRFQEQTAADFSRSSRVDRDEDGYPDCTWPVIDPLHCQSCGVAVPELLPCTWDADLKVGSCCAVLPEEECECHFNGDQADASDCEAHGTCRRIPAMADQDTAETLALLARAGCTRAEAATWMSIIEERIA